MKHDDDKSKPDTSERKLSPSPGENVDPIDRRTVLKWAAAGAGAFALGATGCGPGEVQPLTLEPTPGANPDDDGVPTDFDAEGAAPAEDIFSFGVQAGDARPTSALLWTIALTAGEKTLRVWRDSDTAGEIVLVTERQVTPEPDGSIRVDVEGLSPGATYRYAFFDGDRRSDIGTVRTAFADGAVWPVTIAAATCTNFSHMPYTALEVLADEQFDVFVHLGDMSYNDGALSVAEYRAKWRRTLADPGYRAVLPQASLLMSWDDHEFTNNLNPETVDPALVDNAKTSFFEHLAVRSSGPNGRIWQSNPWGDSVEFITLDSRTERVPSTRGTDASVYLGAEQMAFFKTRLKESTARFKVILNSVPVTQMTELWASSGDRWQGYASEREEVLNFIIDEDIQDVFFLSGDFHVGFVARVEATGPRSRIWEIAVGPTGNLGNPLAGLIEIDPFEYGPLVFPEPQFRYGRGKIAATTLSFNPVSGGVHVRFIDGEDRSVLYDEVIHASPLADEDT